MELALHNRIQKNSEENFGDTQDAIDGESCENLTMYSKERLKNRAEFVSDDNEEAWICEVCGHVHYGKKALKISPVCKHLEEYQLRLNSKK